MFQNEARFGLISDPRRCWAPPGVRPIVSTQIVRQYTYAYAAVSPHDGVLDSLVLPWVNAETMSYYLAEVGRRDPHEFILMVVDGAGWHVANDLAVPENLHLVRLPPRSPELMPAEHLWDEIREKGFANRVFDGLDAVDDQLVDQLRASEAHPARVKSLAGFDRILRGYPETSPKVGFRGDGCPFRLGSLRTLPQREHLRVRERERAKPPPGAVRPESCVLRTRGGPGGAPTYRSSTDAKVFR